MSDAPLDRRLRLPAADPGRDAALRELRSLLVRGLKAGLRDRTAADEAFIEDAAQEALPRVLSRLDQFAGRSRFSTWAVAIALNTAFTELRRKHWSVLSLERLREQGVSVGLEVDPAPDPHRRLVREALTGLLHRLIATELTQRQRDMLVAELQGMPLDEIARQMGLTRNAVYKLGHDARRSLKRALLATGHDADDLHSYFAG